MLLYTIWGFMKMQMMNGSDLKTSLEDTLIMNDDLMCILRKNLIQVPPSFQIRLDHARKILLEADRETRT